MTNSHRNPPVKSLVGRLLLLAPLALVGVAAPAHAQAPPSAGLGLGLADPSAPLHLTPAERTAIRDAVRQDKGKPAPNTAPKSPVSIGVQLPASTALRILPDAALAQAPAAKTVQYTVIENQVVLVDPTNMRVVDIINQ
jgi:hypothetical protein